MKYISRIILVLWVITFIMIYSCLGFIAMPSQAVDLVVTNENDSGAGSLRDVLCSALDGDTITFAEGVKQIRLISTIVIEKSVNIRAVDADTNPMVTITSPENSAIFNYNGNVQVGFYGLILESINDQSNNSLHASIYSRNGNIVVEDCKFTGANQYNCGAIFAGLGEVTVKRSSFDKYKAQYGGAVFTLNGAITVINSSFVNNTANEGGAIYSLLNDVYALNSSFTGNTAIRGSAIWCGNGKISVVNSQFIGGSASDEGAIYGVNSDVTAYNSSFVGNSALNGSAITTLNRGDIILVNTTLYGNNSLNASDYSSAVIESVGKTVLVQSTLVNNQVMGIISKVNEENIYAYNSIIVGNTDKDGKAKQSNKDILGGTNVIEDIPKKGINSYSTVFGSAKLENGHIAPLSTVYGIDIAPELTGTSFLEANLMPDQIKKVLNVIQRDAVGNIRTPPNILGAIEKLTQPASNDFAFIILICGMIILIFMPLIVYAVRSGVYYVH